MIVKVKSVNTVADPEFNYAWSCIMSMYAGREKLSEAKIEILKQRFDDMMKISRELVETNNVVLIVDKDGEDSNILVELDYQFDGKRFDAKQSIQEDENNLYMMVDEIGF